MRAQVVVIGAGIMSAAAAWALSARGHAVVVLEARRAGPGAGTAAFTAAPGSFAAPTASPTPTPSLVWRPLAPAGS